MGDLTRTEVGLVYIKGLAPESVGEVRSRIRGIKIDGILGSSYIEDFYRINPDDISQVFNERPDRVAGRCWGRVADSLPMGPLCLGCP